MDGDFGLFVSRACAGKRPFAVDGVTVEPKRRLPHSAAAGTTRGRQTLEDRSGDGARERARPARAYSAGSGSRAAAAVWASAAAPFRSNRMPNISA